jgi:hypothetical protein
MLLCQSDCMNYKSLEQCFKMFMDCLFISCRSAWNVAWASCIDDLLVLFTSDWLFMFVLLRFGRLLVDIGMWKVLALYYGCVLLVQLFGRHS